MNKVFLFTLFIVLITIFTTGCWNYREIEKLGLVSGMAIDKGSSGKGYEMTAEVIDISASTREPRFNSIRMQSYGESIFECVRNMINISAKPPYWSHATTMIISKDVAKEGIIPILDWIVRDAEPRLTLYLLISKTPTAKEILSLQSLSTEIRSFEIENMVTSNKRLSQAPNILASELTNDISNKGISAIIPTVDMVYNEGKQTMALSGGAILNKDKLAGFIGLEDVKYYLFVRNKIEGGLLTIDITNSTTLDNVTLEIFKNKTKVTPIVSNGKLSMHIKIKTEAAIGESDTPINILREPNIQHIKHTAEEFLKNNILKLINSMQKDFGLDIFGFGSIVKKKDPKLWKEIDDNWGEIFKDLDVEIDVNVHIRGSGHLSKIIKMH
ncbi:Ger(x)C family spore germination protein [Tissierella carlieri]|uniref:Ger(X)C family spore germination protein n=1 Tax=Tissierella carlieri TaxID=689904 RepID=A0ABT1SAV3_9FIRM|nr:Ger(x)C family spore germination protein [Tissierella carlieri]MCQ4923132.1 Ger(x)C family spore germination protein [Tissierella carlieri]